MNITPGGNPISFSSIDNPLEAFVTPPNDSLVGILMGQLPKDRVEIRGSLGGKEFSYLYTLDKEKIAMRGSFDGLPFKYDGTFANDVSMTGTMGENQLSSSITPEVQGPRTTSHAGEVELSKVDGRPPGKEWKLAWSDEFDGPNGSVPDPTKWTYEKSGDS